MRSNKNHKQNKAWFVAAILVLLTLPLLFSGFVRNTDSRDTLVLLGNDDLPPIVYNDKGSAKGVAVDIAKAIGKKIDYDIKVLGVNWEQAQQMLQRGEADGLLHINPSYEREKLFDCSDPLLKSEFSLFVQIDNTGLRDISDLDGRIVGAEPGGYPSVLLERHENIIIENIYNWDASFKALSSGEIDAIIVDRWIGEYELAKSKVSGIKIVEPPIETQYSRIAVRKGDSKTLALINSGLRELADDGTIDKIMEQWQGKRVIYLTKEYFSSFLLGTTSIFFIAGGFDSYLFSKKISETK